MWSRLPGIPLGKFWFAYSPLANASVLPGGSLNLGDRWQKLSKYYAVTKDSQDLKVGLEYRSVWKSERGSVAQLSWWSATGWSIRSNKKVAVIHKSGRY